MAWVYALASIAHGVVAFSSDSVAMALSSDNIDTKTVTGFGHEWSKFRQDKRFDADRSKMFAAYFGIFPWTELSPEAVGLDAGCGSGRWAVLVAPRVKHLHVLDPSAQALAVARENLAGAANISFHEASIDAIPLADASLDFAYSLGVLHHIPDPARAIRDIARKLKPQAPLLVYIYYAFDNRPLWFRALWRVSDAVRRVVSRLPVALQNTISLLFATLIYWPLARTARLLERAGRLPAAWPLTYYRQRSFYVMRTDAYDRFCTRLEQRFTRAQIEAMLRSAGFSRIQFSGQEPFWCAVAFKA